MMLNLRFLVAVSTVVLTPVCAIAQKAESVVFGTMSSGETVMVHTLQNSNGLRIKVMDYGATLISVEVPDRDGKIENVTLSLERLEEYLAGHPLLGSTVGRFANRIAGGGFTIDGKQYDLETVNAKTGVHIHGGKTGFARQLWQGRTEEDRIVLELTSKDGHEGYPGELRVTATYILSGEDELIIQYEAETTKPTHVNLTNHVYWNLNGSGKGNVLDHLLRMPSRERLEVDSTQVPTGKRVAVKGTSFDFLEPKAVGKEIKMTPDERGYDHFFLSEGIEHGRSEVGLIAVVESLSSGRLMEVESNQGGAQLYTANFLKSPFRRHQALCLETQAPPNAPNEPAFDSTLLRPGERYLARTKYRFSTRE